MRRFTIALALIALSLPSFGSANELSLTTSPSTNPTSLPEENARLKARIAELERQLAEVRQPGARWRDQERQLRAFTRPPMPRRFDQIERVPTLREFRLDMPRGSMPFKFNGITYYIVPLGREQ